MNPHNIAYFAPELNTAIKMSVNGELPLKGHSHKFTRDEVICIKLWYHIVGMTYSAIAEKYNTQYQYIYNIINKKRYKDVKLNFMTKIPESFHEETDGKYRDIKIKGHK